ncbi:hypothetical protein IGI04_026304 [Brassica rapa subsp. trilocularis]|uniref:Uncharacterized protein n=1 Tax=Brassica rapa subsp. trilocularis TaxID=1813537 RepID=A0ABQ7KWW3_BRACM|nr:hypothetical protein IGI04_026304 [Brassica rapa subsp. trilocularis]
MSFLLRLPQTHLRKIFRPVLASRPVSKSNPFHHTLQICVWKVRNKVAGQIGDAYLCYDRLSPITPEKKPERRSNRRP